MSPMRRYLNWKGFLVVAALAIVSATLYYTNELARHLAAEEKRKVNEVVAAIRSLNSDPTGNSNFALSVVEGNKTIPFIIATEDDSIPDFVNNTRNIEIPANDDTLAFLREKLHEFKQLHPPVVSDFGTGKNYIYYGESYLLTQLRYFPYVQLTIILLFLAVTIIALSAANRSMQNQVWVGLSKETAHQLGTPLSSIVGWLELLKENEANHEPVAEMEKDLGRLQLVADRFSKVGSAPQLHEENLVPQLQAMVDYMQKRSPAAINISFQTNEEEVPIAISGPLFDWVIENLLRNALDAMDGKGSIKIILHNTPNQVLIDISDTGKGIPKHQLKKVFSPGFTTKKRGWGLGLSLARRIIQQYHHGSLYVRHSEVGNGTTFRIVLRR